MASAATNLSWDEARAVLGVSADASEADVRAAYLEKVRRHSPDRDPEQFERVRDAYDMLRDPGRRVRQVLEGPDPSLPLVSVLGDEVSSRQFVGPDPWMALLREKTR